MKYLLIVLTLTMIGCKNDRFRNTTPASTFDDGPVKVDSMPNNTVPDFLGNVGQHKRVYKVATLPASVWIKRSNTANWEEIPHLGQDVATYAYEAVTKEVRFQNCTAQWGYAIYY